MDLAYYCRPVCPIANDDLAVRFAFALVLAPVLAPFDPDKTLARPAACRSSLSACFDVRLLRKYRTRLLSASFGTWRARSRSHRQQRQTARRSRTRYLWINPGRRSRRHALSCQHLGTIVSSLYRTCARRRLVCDNRTAVTYMSELPDRNVLGAQLRQLGDLTRDVNDDVSLLNAKGVNALTWILCVRLLSARATR